MREAGGPEVVAERRGQPAVVAEHDAAEQREPLAACSACERALHVRAQPVGDASDPTPPADDAGVAGIEHHVDTTPLEPGALVEAGLGPSRRLGPRAHDLEHCAAGRRAPFREHDEDTLANPVGAEALDVPEHAQRIAHATGG